MTVFRDWRLALVFAISAVLWASAFVAIRIAIREYSPAHLALFRFVTASGVLAVCAVFLKIRRPEWRDWPGLALTGFCGVFIYQTFLNWGEQTVTAGSAAFLVNTAPIFTAILAGLFLGEKLASRQKLGVAICFAGALLIALGEKGGLKFSGGASLITIAACSSACYIVLQKHFLERYTPFELTAYAFWMGTAMLLVFLPGLFQEVKTASPEATWAVLYLGILPGALGNVAWALIIQKTTAATGAVLLYVVPVLSVLLAWPILGETPTMLSIIGGSVALIGVLVVNAKRAKAPLSTLAVAPLEG